MEISALEETLTVLLRNAGKQLTNKAASYPRRVGFYKSHCVKNILLQSDS
jgi:hypothetical protein